MFDQTTRALIASARPLDQLDLDHLPERLTSAYTAIVTLRVRLRGAAAAGTLPSEIQEHVVELQKLARTYETMACLLPQESAQRAPCAFVAATARKLLHQLAEVRASTPNDRPIPVQLRVEGIPSIVSAMLLFLVAGAYPDALEIAQRLEPVAPDTPEGVVVARLLDLVHGRFRDLAGSALSPLQQLDATDDDRLAAQVLWRRLQEGLRALGTQILGDPAPLAGAKDIFSEVRQLSVVEMPTMWEGGGRRALVTAAGSHHLATLLESATDLLVASATRSLPSPPGLDGRAWRSKIAGLASHFPYLWANHRMAAEAGVLKSGVSAAVSFPTGAGKSTLIMLKIAVCLAAKRRSALVVAPTLALVDQFRRDLERVFPEHAVERNLEDGDEGDQTDEPKIVVTTPERTLTVLGVDEDAFASFGLIVFDECHHIGARPSDRRCLDAMLCLLNLLPSAKDADVLLVSAMMANAKEVAEWLHEAHGRTCLTLDVDWKPTRQARGCVVFDSKRLEELQGVVGERRQARLAADGNPRPWSGKPRRDDEEGLTAPPFGLFCLRHSWSTEDARDYCLQPLMAEALPLRVAASKPKGMGQSRWYLTPNRNEVAAAIAAEFAATGIKTMVLSQQARDLPSLANTAGGRLEERGLEAVKLTASESDLLAAAAEELGRREGVIGLLHGRVPIHHALLLAPERRFSETVFARKDGARVLAVSPTLSQGVNLPAEAVVIAGDDQWDQEASSRRDLGPEELLNAAGRAGRAGSRSAGVVLVVPGKPVSLSRPFSKRLLLLKQRVLSKSDQCLVLDDPLTMWLDRLQILSPGDLDEEAQYVLRRLPIESTEDPRAAEVFLRRSFGAYRARRDGREFEFTTQIAHALELRRQLAEESNASWQLQVASRTGISLGVIDALAKGFPEGSDTPTTVGGWLDWWFDWMLAHPDRGLVELGGPVFRAMFPGVTAEELKSPKHLEPLASEARWLLGRWMGGEPLCVLQDRLDVWKEQRSAKKKAKKRNAKKKLSATSMQCRDARRFVLQGARQLTFRVAGLPQIYCHRAALEEAPAELQALSGCIREGFEAPEQLALFLIRSGRYSERVTTRMRIRMEYDSLRDKIALPKVSQRGFASTVRRVREALRREAER